MRARCKVVKVFSDGGVLVTDPPIAAPAAFPTLESVSGCLVGRRMGPVGAPSYCTEGIWDCVQLDRWSGRVGYRGGHRPTGLRFVFQVSSTPDARLSGAEPLWFDLC